MGALTLALAGPLLLAPPASSTVSAAPSGVTVTRGSGDAVTIEWTAAVGDAAITYEALAYSTESGGTGTSICTSSSTSCTGTLARDTSFYVDVTASDAAPSSLTSSPRVLVPGTPSAPQNVLITGSEGGLFVSWSAPSSDGGSAVLDYVAEAYSAESGGSPVESCSTATPSERSCQIEPLTGGTAYYVSVYAQNAVGDGAASSRVRAVAGAVPSAPRSVHVARVATGIEVHWLPPASTGSSAITSYTARAFTSSSSSADAVAACSTTELTCTITGVSSTTRYYVAVLAANASGEGAPSARVLSTVAGAPTAPRSVTVTRGDGFAKVRWTAPASTGGSTITRYVARAHTAATGGSVVAECSPVSTRLECDLGPLPNGSTYFVDVRATNHYAEGPASEPRVSVTTATTPMAPREVSAYQAPSGILVQWRTPEADGGYAISSYTARAWSAAAGGTITAECTTSGSQCAIAPKTGAPVFVDVIAKTTAGTSPASAPRAAVALVEPVDAPRAVTVRAKGKRWVVSWSPPEDAIAGEVLRYTASVRGASVAECAVEPASSSSALSCLIAPPSGTARVTVSASTATTTTSSLPVEIVKRTARPSAPQEIAGTPGEGELLVEWAAPAWQGTSTITGYRVRAWSKAKGGSVVAGCQGGRGLEADCLVEGVSDFEPVWVDVTARNGSGWGTPSARVRMEPKPSPPGRLPQVTITPVSDGIEVSWSGTPFDGGYPIRGYVVRVTSDEAGEKLLGGCRTKAAARSCTVTGLPPGTYGWISVAAVNTVGAGEAWVEEGTVPFS